VSVSLRKEEYGGTYGWGWFHEDNPDRKTRSKEPLRVRVVRYTTEGVQKLSEPMSHDEAIEYCLRIIKITGGQLLDSDKEAAEDFINRREHDRRTQAC
jgi:hypothetical protein